MTYIVLVRRKTHQTKQSIAEIAPDGFRES